MENGQGIIDNKALPGSTQSRKVAMTRSQPSGAWNQTVSGLNAPTRARRKRMPETSEINVYKG